MTTSAASDTLGRPVWYELMTTDTRPPKRFTRTWSAGPRRRWGAPIPTPFKRSGDVRSPA